MGKVIATVKKSKFNFCYKRKEDQNIIYNTFSKALIALSDDEFLQYRNDTMTDAETLEELENNGVLVKDDFDENAFLKYFHYKTKFSNETLYLTIAPTLDCNFACPYCYENRRKGKMSQEVQEAVIEFIEDTISKGTRKLDISWYGGEPLLYPEIVESMSRKINAIAQEASCTVSMHMVTNGYLLTDKLIEMLDEVGVTRIQITLDGSREYHDVRRPLRNGDGTFDKIMENLKLFADSPIEVMVRMNVDNQNQKDFMVLKKMILALDNPNVKLYTSPVEDINKDTVNHVSDFMTTEEFDNFTLKACEDGGLSEEDFSVMDDRFCFCTAETENCYVVDDRGDVYKCWDEVGRLEHRCFNMLDPESTNYMVISKYLAWDPFENDKCSNCVYLPLCFGGCKFQRTNLNKSVCGFNEDVLKSYLETAFFRE